MNNKYLVLARKYRPQTFDDLIGQEVLVRTLTNAINSGKLAQSYILTGIRGIGKTTSARIIAKALNCIGLDGKSKETPNPCGVCEHCRAITEDRHVDVQEIDAASNTGVDNAREIIEGTRYNPVSARYKIYIIDEVHMLSKAAFNALLKTLEEPPEKVKFIFATTEIRKVPITVLSRCQRFDLRRIDDETLFKHFSSILKQEKVEAEDGALTLIAKCADGSVRDGLSLLDQAIAQSNGKITADGVREMIGISSKENIIAIYKDLLQGRAPDALMKFKNAYNQGYEPVSVIQDLLDTTHLLTKLKLKAAAIESPNRTLAEKDMLAEIAAAVEMPVLAMFWQMLLKGIDEMKYAPSALQAAEMVLVRMCHMQGSVPTPDNIARVQAETATAPAAAVAAVAAPAPVPSTPAETKKDGATFASFAQIAEHARKQGEFILASNLSTGMRIVRFEDGIIDFMPGKNMPDDLHYALAKKLLEWTGKRWTITQAKEGSAQDTLEEQDTKRELAHKAETLKSSVVQDVLKAFTGIDPKSIEITQIETDDDESTEEEE